MKIKASAIVVAHDVRQHSGITVLQYLFTAKIGARGPAVKPPGAGRGGAVA
jgi:hypothetical protein